MKKLIVVLAIVLSSSLAFGWTLGWDDPGNEDGIIVSYKNYPSGYSYPDNLAPANLVQNMTGATQIALPKNTIEWEIPESFTDGTRYVFFVQATKDGSISGDSDYLCWTYPAPGAVVELPISGGGGGIQINIYQSPR